MNLITNSSRIGSDPLSKKALGDFINVVSKIKDIKGREYRMGNLTELLEVARKLNSYCKTIDELTVSCQSDYENEEFVVNQEVTRMKSDMQTKYQNFQYRYFTAIRENIDRLIDILKDDYNVSGINAQNGVFGSFSENEKLLSQHLQKINDLIEKLNRTDFYSLVPPAKVEIDGESFTVTRGNNTQTYNCDSSKMTRVNDPKPLETTVMELYRYCSLAKECVAMLMRQHEKEFDIPAFEAHVDAAANQWLRDKKNALDKKYKDTFNELFVDTNKKAVPQSFFDAIEQDAQKTRINPEVGATTYNEVVNIGDLGLVVESDPTHLGYFSNSPVLKKNMGDGQLRSPLLLDLKKAGNILLNVNGDTYSEDVIDFVNQVVIRFLLSFPANRINFCLIDIDNKIGFSHFKSLTKINNGILLNGIIRDDRQLENTIKDMEQRMYSIDDDILSYNGVPNIFEYNRKYEANPQNVYLFVLVNYPSGMRDDIAKRIQKIVSNGNRAGIFSLIVNNSACPLPPGYKQAEYAQFIEGVKKSSLTIDHVANAHTKTFYVNGIPYRNVLNLNNDVSVPMLPKIVEMLRDDVEKNKQKVIPLSLMFESTDDIENSPKGIPSSAEVLDIPIGARGGEIQNILLKTTGDGSAHAVLIGGTGSGKSNLLHTIIMNACYKYSPLELNLYLVDFKGGVEFKYYEANKNVKMQLPHIKLTGLTSDLEDGVAILNNLHKELRRREDEFRQCGVEDIVQYRSIGNSIPRLFVIIDEIQELFEQDDRLGQKAIDILRELFKKGRAFGINILWASQNIPNAPGLKDKVLSQIGNRISLRLNEPDDAIDIKIDPKVVKALNRPEKGLGVINDIRYGNDSVEFRVAYAETSENRQKYSQIIIDKWARVAAASMQEPLFIVGDDDEPSPVEGRTFYTKPISRSLLASKAFDNYVYQLGQDYVTGKPFNVELGVRSDKSNILMAGYDLEVLRDMMGYALLSTVMNQLGNKDYYNDPLKIYYANGEMLNTNNANDLFNVVRNDFASVIENVSSNKKMEECITSVYKLYKARSNDSDNLEEAKAYTPCFVVIHSLQRFVDLFANNTMLTLVESKVDEQAENVPMTEPSRISASNIEAMFGARASSSYSSPVRANSKQTAISFADAFKELLSRGGIYGIHFILSIDNPLGIQQIKNELTEIEYKIFTKGISANVASQMIDDYKIINSLNNPKVAIVAVHNERSKMRMYRYDQEADEGWYRTIQRKYSNLLESDDE